MHHTALLLAAMLERLMRDSAAVRCRSSLFEFAGIVFRFSQLAGECKGHIRIPRGFHANKCLDPAGFDPVQFCPSTKQSIDTKLTLSQTVCPVLERASVPRGIHGQPSGH